MTDQVVAKQIEHVSLTSEVKDSFGAAADPRLAECLQILVEHLHAAVREMQPTLEEWERAVDFLTRTGQKCDATRQEFVLLSDVLGISSLVETLNHSSSDAATEATVLGPFHMTESPARELGDSIDELGKPDQCLVRGRVLGDDGTPIPGAVVDVWQADENGFYDVQVPDVQPAGNGRGLFRTDESGRFWFTTVVPAHYPIPTDGPVGELLIASNRHPYRPAHIHFIARAPGFEALTTHIFVAGSPYLDSDAVFAVKHSLVRDFVVNSEEADAAAYHLPSPFRVAEIDLVLAPTRPDDL